METRILIMIMGFMMSNTIPVLWAQELKWGKYALCPSKKCTTGSRRPDYNSVNKEQRVIQKSLENPELAAEIGLSNEQIIDLREGFYELKKENIRKHAELDLAAIEQARVLTDSKIDESNLMLAVEKTGRIRTELAKLQMKRVLLIYHSLDEKQRKKIANMSRRHMKAKMARQLHGDRSKFGDQRLRSSDHYKD